ncbi:hypothetical protein F5888DRAFT_927817 [Russula emetica]|nr:hypothetical protein F5888DRAFT_927817 [Russula emetica]
MQWSHLLAKLSPERVQPILREGQCKPPADYKYVMVILRYITQRPPFGIFDLSCSNGLNMPSDYQDSPPEGLDTDDQEETSSIDNFSLLAPPMSHRQLHNHQGPQPDPHQPQSFLDGITTSYYPPVALATTLNSGSAVAPSGPMHGITHTDVLALPNPHPPSPHPPWMHGQAPPPNVPPPQQQPLYRDDGYAPAENLPPQNYISYTRIAPSSGAPYIRPGSRGAPLFLQRQGVSPPVPSIQTPVVPANSELARAPRFTFEPPGAYVPADSIVSTTAAPPSPKSAHSFRDKGKIRFDRTPRQPTQEESLGRARSHSWTVFPSVFRRISGVYIA